MGRAMRRLVTLLAVTFALVAAAPSAGAPADPALRQVRSFALALGSGNLDGDVVGRFAPFDLVVVDGEEARRSQLRALRGHGKLVLAYLSIGTIEPGRSWY